MNIEENKFLTKAKEYIEKIKKAMNIERMKEIEYMAKELKNTWEKKGNVYICGNGGSAANAIHIANEWFYGVGNCGAGEKRPGINIEALCSNQAILTCLANDTGYENVYQEQLKVKAKKGDILIVLSGSGQSKNIVKALNYAKKIGMKSFAILGYSGGKCLQICDHSIHFEINDMQIAEDLQLIVGHICMQWLTESRNIKE